MTYEDWCLNSKYWLAEAEKYNAWRRKAKDKLLTDIGPRIAYLGHRGYMGCGFHYGKETSFGKLVAALALPWQPCANHCDKVEDDMTTAIVNKVIFEGLLRDVVKAEHSAREIAVKPDDRESQPAG